jgi:ElaB/YqjD/DUF883 family membrane-anchored ribosome-binding protein
MNKTLCTLLASLIVASTFVSVASAEEQKQDAALARARKTILMLDDIYKTAVVLITATYVEDEDDVSAGVAAKLLFQAIGKKGWHDARLIDVSGEPYNSDNVANDDFEKKAVKAMKSGKANYDEVIKRDDGRYLRAMTAVPVVMKKCVMCHENYKDAKPGEAIGAISYTLKIE